MEHIYAVCRHYQDGDADSYYVWCGSQILSYHRSEVGANKEAIILAAKELSISLTSADSDFKKDLTRANQVQIFDGVGGSAVAKLEDLYYVVKLDLKP